MSHHEVPSLAILGSYPPPYGGVAIHVQRLCPLLEERGISYRVYNATSDVGDGDRVVPVYSQRKTWLLRYMLTAKEPAVYILSGRLSAWLIGALMACCRGKRVLLRLRNASLPDWIEQGGMKKRLAGFALRRMTGVVCVSRLLLESARRLGVDVSRLHWSPGFLPLDVKRIDRSTVSEAVWDFVGRHKPIISANGKVGWYRGEDLYGLDMLVEMVARLKPDFPRIGIVICFWDHHPHEQAYVDQLIERAEQLGVKENVLFNTTSGEFVPVLAESDVFVRPTNTDGDANSIREAIYLGVPAVASNVVERPNGTILFRTRDVSDLESNVRFALERASKRQKPCTGELTPEDRERIDRYLSLLNEVTAMDRSAATG